MAMDLSSSEYFDSSTFFASQVDATLEGKIGSPNTNKNNPFLDSFPDPLCSLNLKETSEFVKSFPMANNCIKGWDFLDASYQRRRGGVSSATRRNVEAPPTPGRPIFSFSAGNISRKSFPSKWDDAEKWLISGTSFHDSPSHHHVSKSSESSKPSKKCSGFTSQAAEVFAEKPRVTEEKFSKAVSSFQDPAFLYHPNSTKAINLTSGSAADILLQDKFANELEPIIPTFKCSGPLKEGLLFGDSGKKSVKDAETEVNHELQHRDVGTEMTPLGSSTTSRCHTPFKSSSPARHNTPANRSGPLALMNSNGSIAQLQEWHLAKLRLGGTQFDSVTSNWSSREAEEEDISKSLRHFELNNEYRKSVSESNICAWEEEEKNKCCLRYQREEAKIQAWVNLQSAKAEAQARKLEVKIQKMRSNLEEKLMKRMEIVHRKAEERSAAAQLQHSEQMQKAKVQARKMMNCQSSSLSGYNTCGCFPCKNI